MKNKILYFSILFCTVFQISFSQSVKPIPNGDSLLISYKKQWQNPQNNINPKAESLKGIVINYFQSQSSTDSLNHYCDLYIQFSVKNQLHQYILDAYFQKVNAKRGQSEWVNLIKTGQEAIKIIDSLKIKASAIEKSLIIDEMVYGYIFLKDIENADFYNKMCVEMLKKENKKGENNEQISTMYLTASRAYGYIEKFKIASVKLDSALWFINKTHNYAQKYVILCGWVSSKVDLKQYKKVLPSAYECLNFYEKNKNLWGYEEIEMLLGSIYLGLNNYDKAIEFCEKSVNGTRNVRILYRNYQTLYFAYKAKKQFGNALFAHEKYIEFHEKLFNEKIANEKNALEKRFAEEKSSVLLNEEKVESLLQKKYKNYFIGGATLLMIISVGLIFD